MIEFRYPESIVVLCLEQPGRKCRLRPGTAICYLPPSVVRRPGAMGVCKGSHGGSGIWKLVCLIVWMPWVFERDRAGDRGSEHLFVLLSGCRGCL